MVVALNSSLGVEIYFFEWKGFMVRKDRRNNFFFLKRKIKHKDTQVN
jgi:hypothetical protein